MSASERSWSATTAALLNVGRCTAALLLLLPAFAASAASSLALNDSDRADLARIETYLNDLDTMQSRFVQANPDGTHSEGTMYLQRPGKLRFEYDPPDPYLIITHGKWFIYVDKELDEATYLPVDKTPAYFIVKKDIKFGGKLRVASFQNADRVFRIEVEQADEPDSGRGHDDLHRRAAAIAQMAGDRQSGQSDRYHSDQPELRRAVERRFVRV